MDGAGGWGQAFQDLAGVGGGVPRRVEGARITTEEDHASGQPVRCCHEWTRWFT